MESRRRNTNFSNQEVKIISEFISERQTTLFAPLSRQVAEVDLSTKSTTAVYVTDFASYKPCLIESEFGVYFKVIIEVERIQTIPQQSVTTQISSTNTSRGGNSRIPMFAPDGLDAHFSLKKLDNKTGFISLVPIVCRN